MKFSWQLTNSFLEIPDRNFQTVLKELILCGIEIDKIHEIQEDTILDLSITTNRKEINSSLSLAREIAILTNIPIKIKPIKFKNNAKNLKIDYLNLDYIRIQVIYEKLNLRTPEWISKYLKVYGEDNIHYLTSIQKYIDLKWGITFKIISTDTLDQFIIENNIQEHLIKKITHINKHDKKLKKIKILIFSTTQKLGINTYNNYDINEFYENYYIDSINIIKESMKCTIGKYYETYKISKRKNQQIIIEKYTLNHWLGSTQKNNKKFLETQTIKNILENLKFHPQYIKNKKSFTITTPKYRQHDIKNKIDIIEEIGRIYKFQNFHNKYQYQKTQGNKSKYFIKINEIRNTLRNLGFNEVINCSLINNLSRTKKIIEINNPLNEEQKELRGNIIKNLLKNYIHNLKYTNDNLLIFEIGKIFEKENLNNKYKEEQYLGGLIYSPRYSRNNWAEKPNAINIFHIKGILELFLEKINAGAYLKEIKKYNIHNSMTDMLKKHNIIGIYNKTNNKIIGILGEINHQIIKLNQNRNNKIYVFEIKLDNLIQTTQIKKHLSYNKQLYSEYPSIIRDISIPMEKSKQVGNIKKQIQKVNQDIIEKIEIFNEYKNIKEENNKYKRFVGIRVKYRSLHKTFNKKDIKKIDDELNNIIGKT